MCLQISFLMMHYVNSFRTVSSVSNEQAKSKSSWAWNYTCPDGTTDTVYFGHDAARGLQIYDHAVGIDTGEFCVSENAGPVLRPVNILFLCTESSCLTVCCMVGCVYGRELTAMLLPEKRLVSVPAREVYRR